MTGWLDNRILSPFANDMNDEPDDSEEVAYPPQVEALHTALRLLRAVREVTTGIKNLQDFDPWTYSLPGEFGDLPHALLRRTEGGLPDEVWVHTEFELTRDEPGWLTLEFLAWWVRDMSRGGELVQLRPMALPPRAYEIQLGTTLKFIIDQFFVVPDEDLSVILAAMKERAASLNAMIRSDAETLGSLVDAADDDGQDGQ